MNNKAVVNNVFDYSNILPTVEYIKYLVNYLDNIYNQFLDLIKKDEEKNSKFKYEYKDYMYGESYGCRFYLYIYEKGYNNIKCDDYNTFISAINNGDLKNVRELSIQMDLDFKRGRNNNYTQYENSFSIIFNPYNIKFTRKSNYNDINMNQIENQVNEILKKFPVANCIFCDKG